MEPDYLRPNLLNYHLAIHHPPTITMPKATKDVCPPQTSVMLAHFRCFRPSQRQNVYLDSRRRHHPPRPQIQWQHLETNFRSPWHPRNHLSRTLPQTRRKGNWLDWGVGYEIGESVCDLQGGDVETDSKDSRWCWRGKLEGCGRSSLGIGEEEICEEVRVTRVRYGS